MQLSANFDSGFILCKGIVLREQIVAFNGNRA
jgi:hypothetical protein